jgi:hypothetical protein
VVVAVSLLWTVAAVVIAANVCDSAPLRELQLRSSIHMLRGQIMLYQVQHRNVAPDGRRLSDLMVGKTNEAGEIGAKDARLGPYVPRWQANPLNGRNTVRVIEPGEDVKPDDSTGWIYQSDGPSFSLMPNSTKLDAKGVPVVDY